MREILFRGKSSVTGKWVCGNYMRTIIGGKDVDLIVPICGFADLAISQKMYQINPETLGQYTGLTDKNGTRIFEGDFVELYHILKCPVPLGSENGVLKRRVIAQAKIINETVALESLPRYSHLICYLDDPEQELEVIGNIYDNLKLLEEEKQ